MKSKHLLTDAIYMSRKLSRFNDLNTELNNIVKKNGLNENDFTKIFHALNEERNLEQLWSVFQKNFDLIYPEFFKKLIQIAPDLTQQEIKHCCFIRLNFETKEIAQMFSVKPTSIQIGRVRIKKKLKLDHDQNLTTFIHLLWKIIRYLISFIAKISLY